MVECCKLKDAARGNNFINQPSCGFLFKNWTQQIGDSAKEHCGIRECDKMACVVFSQLYRLICCKTLQLIWKIPISQLQLIGNYTRAFSPAKNVLGFINDSFIWEIGDIMNDGTSLRSVRQIRRMEYPEYNLGKTRTSQINNIAPHYLE